MNILLEKRELSKTPREFMYIIDGIFDFEKNAKKIIELSGGKFMFWPYFWKEVTNEFHSDENLFVESEVSINLQNEKKDI